MTKMRRRDKLTAVRRYVRDNGPVAFFYASNDGRGFQNLRYLRLMVITEKEVKILPCTVIRNDGDGQKVMFAANGLCRISNGQRRGMYIKPERLRMNEKAVKAGLVKALGLGPGTLDVSQEKDKQLVDRMFQAIQDPLDSDSLLYPIYMIRTSDRTNLSPRLVGKVAKSLKVVDGYNPGLAFEDNFYNLVDSFSEPDPTSDTHRLYPFDMCNGLGLVMFDAESLPPAQRLTEKVIEQGDELTEIYL